MPESTDRPTEPTEEELQAIFEDLGFFLAMDEAEALPLEENGEGEEGDTHE